MLLEIIKKTEVDGQVWYVTHINNATDKYFPTEEEAKERLELVKAQAAKGGDRVEVIYQETI